MKNTTALSFSQSFIFYQSPLFLVSRYFIMSIISTMFRVRGKHVAWYVITRTSLHADCTFTRKHNSWSRDWNFLTDWFFLCLLQNFISQHKSFPFFFFIRLTGFIFCSPIISVVIFSSKNHCFMRIDHNSYCETINGSTVSFRINVDSIYRENREKVERISNEFKYYRLSTDVIEFLIWFNYSTLLLISVLRL